MKTIVLDTNIWISELALMSPIGCAFNHYVTVSGFKIGLPEVVEEETKYNFRKNLLKYRSDIEKNYRLMLAIFGTMKELVMPSIEDIERKVQSIFDFHKDRIIRVPFEIKGARSSFDKIIKKEPPSSGNRQQFKDGVIWANCLELAKSSEVLLVTNDPDFYKERTLQKGLAENLLLEARNAAYIISPYSQLSDLLKEIRSDLKLDEDQLVKLIEKETFDNVLKISERMEFVVEKLSNRKFEVFATTDPKEVSVKFFLKYDLDNKSTEHRINAYAESRGEFLLNIESYDIKNFRNLGEYVFWINEAGELKETKNIYGYANFVLGHKTIEHQVSYKLGER
ncbi:MAG: hypothetical protein DDT22_01213 [candidate division WS2 bacterium]|nr:hypothetical protein [Candidatus Lithacetigena glycinireducens]